MNTSASWINEYLMPPASAEEQADLLTRAGFPLEHTEAISLPNGGSDVRQDIELTSNRGDCLCHVGLAREIAAVSGRSLMMPRGNPASSGPPIATIARVENREPMLCPLYTARIIRGVRVGPSPEWLANRLIARGDIPRNNIVDASNFVLFELGQPTHVFDLAKLRGSPPRIVVRRAMKDELFVPIGEGAAEVKLTSNDLVIADADRAVAIAGVKGGALTAVSSTTTDILIEAATFDPVTVRAASRRHGIASDSSFRFERGVHAGQIEDAANRLTDLILQLCGGTLCDGVLSDGVAIPPRRTVVLRCDRCRQILGIPLQDGAMSEALSKLGFDPVTSGGNIHCTIPYSRLDIHSEIDLIEEVGRIIGLDQIPIADTLQVRVAPPQAKQLARQAVHESLTGMGYLETVTHSLISDDAASKFLPLNLRGLRVADARAAEPALRPSLLPSLMQVLSLNRDRGVKDIKVFESAATFATQGGQNIEQVNLAFIHPAESSEDGIREARGVIDRLIGIIFSGDQAILVESTAACPWFSVGASISIGDQLLGTMGVIAPNIARAFGLTENLIAAEIGLPRFYDRYPPEAEASELPSFPSIERDVSAIVDDHLPWSSVHVAIAKLSLQHLEFIEFVTTFRGKQIGAGRKSITLRLRFRAADRTLTHQQVDPQMQTVMDMLRKVFNAEIRS